MGIYLINTKSDSTTHIRFPEAHLVVNRVRANPAYLIAHNSTLAKSVLARFKMTSVELKSFTYSKGPISLSNENAVFRQLPKPLLFPIIKNKNFTSALEINPYFPPFRSQPFHAPLQLQADS